MSDQPRPTLTDPRGLGGLIAQDGFDYQVWDALARIPAWLRNPAFEGFGVELLEDVEARFFAPHAPQAYVIDRFQAKAATLTRGELIEVFETFRTFDQHYPQTARVHTLVTPALPKGQAYLARDPARVRAARPFYAPFADVRGAIEDQLRQDVAKDLGGALGDYFVGNVEVALVVLPDRAVAQIAFAAALDTAFPALDLSARAAGLAFQALWDLVSAARGRMITRAEVLSTFRQCLGRDLLVDGRLPLHVRSDRNEPAGDAIEIDAAGYSGGNAPFPAPEVWTADLLAALDQTQRWARAHGRQRIALTGAFRLTTAFALGYTFRSAVGFEIDIPTREGAWPTDVRPEPDDPPPPWRIQAPQALMGDRLVVCVGVIRDPATDVLGGLALGSAETVLSAVLAGPLTSAREAQASVGIVKAAVAEACARLWPAQIDLFFVGPAAFAVALGHRWNGLPPTLCHEFVAAERRYVPTAKLG